MQRADLRCASVIWRALIAMFICHLPCAQRAKQM